MPGVRGAMMHGAILRTLVRSLVPALAATVLGLSLAAPACAAATNADSALADSALADAEWRAIQGTISGQLAALKAGNAGKAFAQASPSIRQQFGTAANFLAMVRAAYGALIAARYTEFLEGAIIEGNVIQPLRLVAPDNSVQVALYTMQKQSDGRWKISGCVLAPSTVHAV
jgi:hypothetical protein